MAAVQAPLHRPAGLVADSGEAERLDGLLSRIRSAADEDAASVWAEAERCLEALSGGPADLRVATAGGWFDWRHLDAPLRGARDGGDPLQEPETAEPGACLVIREGSIIARLARPVGSPAAWAGLRSLAGAIDMALTLCDGRERVVRSASELEVMRALATRILQTGDLDELLLLVSHETRRLLAADICGVMLREDDEVAMQSCVGNFSAETARLRMAAGIGVAGAVLASGQPCMVQNYVESDAISRDFVPLARTEKVRSALAVPIVSRNATVGVLEVWRRRPSTFGENDTSLLLSLAGLAAIAIDNAKLNQSREKAAEELRQTHLELTERYRTVSQAALFQEEATRLFLGETPLPAVAAQTSEFTGGAVLILNRDLGVEAVQAPEDIDFAAVQPALAAVIRTAGHVSLEALAGQSAGLDFLAQPIGTWAERMGWIVWAGRGRPAQVARLALGHVSLLTAMHLLERRRIARERSKTLEAVLWDLLEGSDLVRAAAIDRARELRAPLKGDVRVIVIAPVGGKNGGLPREEILERIRSSDLGRAAFLAGVRGEQARLICKGTDAERLLPAMAALLADLRAAAAPEAVAGISGLHGDPRFLPAALREALVALEVARHRKSGAAACYDELGMLGLLINLGDKADLNQICRRILGDLLSEPEVSRSTLLATLSAYFQANCSQGETAAQLNIHQKTVAYRLAKISRLTGLDLARHQDRLLADVASKLLGLLDLRASGLGVEVDQ